MCEVAHAAAPSFEERRAETCSVRIALLWPAAQLIGTPGLASAPRRDLRNCFVGRWTFDTGDDDDRVLARTLACMRVSPKTKSY
jgi:hypothetical protein